MIDIQMPAETIGTIMHSFEIARGPFVVEHNDAVTLGALMARNGDDVSFWDGSNTQTIDATYEITGNGTDRVSAFSDVYESSFMFRPIVLADAEWIYPDPEERPNNLEELIFMAKDSLSYIAG